MTTKRNRGWDVKKLRVIIWWYGALVVFHKVALPKNDTIMLLIKNPKNEDKKEQQKKRHPKKSRNTMKATNCLWTEEIFWTTRMRLSWKALFTTNHSFFYEQKYISDRLLHSMVHSIHIIFCVLWTKKRFGIELLPGTLNIPVVV